MNKDQSFGWSFILSIVKYFYIIGKSACEKFRFHTHFVFISHRKEVYSYVINYSFSVLISSSDMSSSSSLPDVNLFTRSGTISRILVIPSWFLILTSLVCPS